MCTLIVTPQSRGVVAVAVAVRHIAHAAFKQAEASGSESKPASRQAHPFWRRPGRMGQLVQVLERVLAERRHAAPPQGVVVVTAPC